MTPRHFLYPLNPKSEQGYYLEDRRGNKYPTSVEGFFDCYSDGHAAEWGLWQLGEELRRNDFIWVHFALPVSAIMAVGRVREAPKFNDELGRYTVWIDWDWALTKRLQQRPIPYSAHKQRVMKSVVAANQKTMSVVSRWLRTKEPAATRPKSLPVRFKPVEIEQRQGQPAFRQALMAAYEFKCAVTGCEIRDVLQAAHIVPVKTGGHHSVNNGLLLRADIHNLFDRGLLTIDRNFRIHLDSSVKTSATYGHLHGVKLKNIPSVVSHRPDARLLEKHRQQHTQT